jgi:hypothetical protein
MEMSGDLIENSTERRSLMGSVATALSEDSLDLWMCFIRVPMTRVVLPSAGSDTELLVWCRGAPESQRYIC